MAAQTADRRAEKRSSDDCMGEHTGSKQRTGRTAMVVLAGGLVTAVAGLLAWRLRRRAAIRAGQQEFGRADAFIERSVSDVFDFCRNLKNLQSIVSQWVMPPGPRAIEPGEGQWSGKLLEERPNELLVWRIVNGSVEHMGRLEFEAAHYGRGTSVVFSIWRLPPESRLGIDLQQEAQESLRRLKVVLESRPGAEAFPEYGQVVPSARTRVTPTEGDLEGWAPESGEPGEMRTGFGRGEASSVVGDDVGLAPESGERFVDQEPESLPEPERFDESAEEYRVTEGSEESFPASDSPSWTPGRT